jgi:trans-resveratrol di-O-methyltransferase
MVVGVISAIHREAQLLCDMMIMTLTKGKERDEDEWCNLFKLAGFNSYTITATIGFRSVIEVYP